MGKVIEVIFKGLVVLLTLVIIVATLHVLTTRQMQVYIDDLETPDWPATAAGVGPASVLVQVDEETVVRVCPTDPDVCQGYTLAPGSYVIRLVVSDDEIWHVHIR